MRMALFNCSEIIERVTRIGHATSGPNFVVENNDDTTPLYEGSDTVDSSDTGSVVYLRTVYKAKR